jgi:tetratricopeptide (TPR) repeat protein
MTGDELLAQGRRHEAEAAFLRAIEDAAAGEKVRVASAAALRALKAGAPQLAVRLYRRAEELSPRDPELPNSRGLAHLEAGEVGLAAHAQAAALSLDPEHVGARAHRAAALEAMGDDAGAALELSELLKRIGPQPALSARLFSLQEAAKTSAARRLLGKPVSALHASPLVGTALARSLHDPLEFRAPFAALKAVSDGGRISRLDLVFDSLDASMGRSDVSYGGTTLDEHDRRVPLDEFTAAGVVFLAESLGIETFRARRILSFLLTPDCGMNQQQLAGVRLGWTVSEDEARHYGLYAQL